MHVCSYSVLTGLRHKTPGLGTKHWTAKEDTQLFICESLLQVQFEAVESAQEKRAYQEECFRSTAALLECAFKTTLKPASCGICGKQNATNPAAILCCTECPRARNPTIFGSGFTTALWRQCCHHLHVVNDMKWETVR
ncbi:hypothetical protein E5288_WYG012941 [Bos mutus]|uniref:Uncharacterized protein n=1 Tax=Bos mutus TaxID=72004 RepID=A0A6B0R8S6_9CETA|nr:hypothetical protein [Bos mutus]